MLCGNTYSRVEMLKEIFCVQFIYFYRLCIGKKKKLEIMPETIGNVYLNIPLKTYQCKYELSLIKTFLAINSILKKNPVLHSSSLGDQRRLGFLLRAGDE